MNSKQKFGYTILGAVIMAVGIGIGVIVSPTLIAQNNGVFDEIVCTGLTVIDDAGEKVIAVGGSEDYNIMTIYDKQGVQGVKFMSGDGGNQIMTMNKNNRNIGILLGSHDEAPKGNLILLNTPEDGWTQQIKIGSNNNGSIILLKNRKTDEDTWAEVILSSSETEGNQLWVGNKKFGE